MRERTITVDPGTPELRDLTSEAVLAATKWWADHLRKRTPFNNGDAFHSLFHAVVTRDVTIDPEVVDAFEHALTAAILSDDSPYGEHEKMDKGGARIGRDCEHSGVDYHPDSLLQVAINKATDDERARNALALMLPCKTNQRISLVSVSGGAGHGSPMEPIWKAWESVMVAPYNLAHALGAIPREKYHYGVVDRWQPANGRFRPGQWQLGGDTKAQIALITFADVVEPTPIAHVLRGRVDIAHFYDSLEDGLHAAFRDEMGGYLALVKDLR